MALSFWSRVCTLGDWILKLTKPVFLDLDFFNRSNQFRLVSWRTGSLAWLCLDGIQTLPECRAPRKMCPAVRYDKCYVQHERLCCIGYTNSKTRGCMSNTTQSHRRQWASNHPRITWCCIILNSLRRISDTAANNYMLRVTTAKSTDLLNFII
jgi:hypothetical protein